MNFYKKRQINKITALLILFSIAAVLFLSIFFLFSQSDHYCIGENCPICLQMENCVNGILRLTEAVITGIAGVFVFLLLLFIATLIGAALNLRPVSLVTLKVRMDD